MDFWKKQQKSPESRDFAQEEPSQMQIEKENPEDFEEHMLLVQN